MDTDFKDTFFHGLDSLESAFSDSARKVVRQIKIDWQKVMKYKSDLSSKEDELFAIKDKIMYLSELKSQNEKYLNTTQSKLENLKQSNMQLKGKLGNLKNEEERLAKKCTEEEEYLQKKLSLYEDKWRKRFTVYCSKNPKLQEQEKAIKEMEELKGKLLILSQELQKHEKDLFQAKCERNRRTIEESEICPFNTFVVKVANIYVDTKKVLDECEKTSQEIAAIHRNIQNQKLKRQISQSHDPSDLENSTMMEVEDITNTFDERGNSAHHPSQIEHFESKRIEDKTRSGRNFQTSHHGLTEIEQQMEICNDNHPEYTKSTIANLENTKQYSENSSNISYFEPDVVVTKDSSVMDSRNFRDESSDSVRGVSQAPLGKGTKNIITFQTGGENFPTTAEKTVSKDKKVRKWLDRLKVFVPSFANAPEEVNKGDTTSDNKKSSSCVRTQSTEEKDPKRDSELPHDKLRNICRDTSVMDSEILEKEHSVGFKVNAKESKEDLKYQNTLTSTSITVESNIANIDMYMPNATEQRTSNIKNTSKYFSMDDSGIYVNWDATPTTEKNELTKSMGTENEEKNALVETMNVQENIIDFQIDAYKIKKSCKFEDTVNNKKGELKERDQLKEQDKKGETDNTLSETAKENLREPCTLFESTDKKDIKSTMKCTDSNGVSSVLNKDDDDGYQNKFENLKVSEQTSLIHENQITSKEIPSVVGSKSTTAALPAAIATDEDQRSVQLQSLNSPQDQTNDFKPDKGNESNDITAGNEKEADKSNSTSNVSPMDIIINSPYISPGSAIPTPLSTDQTQRSGESNPKTPLTRPVQNSTMTQEGMILSGISPYKADSASPGFAYTTRLMYQANAENIENEPPKEMSKELQNKLFAQLSYFNGSPMGTVNIPHTHPTPDDDKNEFLASAYEDYLTDSPPQIKGTEKSMFTFADDSPDKEGKDDFFPLFAAENGESSKDSKNSGGQFMFNFCNTSNEKSPDETPGFKFMF